MEETQPVINKTQERIRKRMEAMGQAPIWKLLLRFSGPSIISMIVAASFTIVDAIFIGRLGPEALGALTIVFPMMLIYMATWQLVWGRASVRPL